MVHWGRVVEERSLEGVDVRTWGVIPVTVLPEPRGVRSSEKVGTHVSSDIGPLGGGRGEETPRTVGSTQVSERVGRPGLRGNDSGSLRADHVPTGVPGIDLRRPLHLGSGP